MNHKSQSILSSLQSPEPTTETSQQTSTVPTTFAIRAPPGSDSVLTFTADSVGSVSLALISETGNFVIKNEKNNLVEINQKGEEIVMGVSKLSAKSLQFYGDILYKDIPQWKLVVNENFWQEPTGWTINKISTCGGINMLGGFSITSGTENSKKFKDLPAHKKIRITATFHFIDAWTGETAYMKVDVGRNRALEYVWTERYDSTKAKNAINVCGAHYGEGKLSSSIDITLPHIEDDVTILFGSNLDQDPQEESWGVSNVNIYVMS